MDKLIKGTSNNSFFCILRLKIIGLFQPNRQKKPDNGSAFKNIKNHSQNNYPALFAVVLALVCFNLFFRLDALPVQDWDEGREGVTAYEMVRSGDYLKTSYLDQTDYDNTKPTLLFWSISLSYRIFGFNLFAMRFPSAFFALITVVLVMLAAKKKYNGLASLLSGVILSTTYAFVHHHSARRGDFDSLLVLLITVSLLLLLGSDSNSGPNTKKKTLFYLSGFAAGLAFLAKSFAALQIPAVLLVFLFITKKFKNYRVRDYLGYFSAFLLPIAVWAVFRFQADGLAFFRAMAANDIVERAGQVTVIMPNLSIWYFGILLAHFLPWSLFLFYIPFYNNSFQSAALSAAGKGKSLRLNLNPFFSEPLFIIWAVVPFVLFSLATNKLAWYINAIFPPLSIWIAWTISDIILTHRKKSKGLLTAPRALVLVAVFVVLYETAFIFVIHGQDRISSQKAFYGIGREGGNTNTIYFANRYANHGERFLARVVKKYKIGFVGGPEEFGEKAAAGDLFYLADSPENLQIVQTNSWKIIAHQNGMMFVRKTHD